MHSIHFLWRGLQCISAQLAWLTELGSNLQTRLCRSNMNQDSATRSLISHFKCFQKLILVDCLGEIRESTKSGIDYLVDVPCSCESHWPSVTAGSAASHGNTEVVSFNLALSLLSPHTSDYI